MVYEENFANLKVKKYLTKHKTIVFTYDHNYAAYHGSNTTPIMEMFPYKSYPPPHPPFGPYIQINGNGDLCFLTHCLDK